MSGAAIGSTPVTVVIGRLTPSVRRGLTDALRTDRRVRILASDLEADALERAVVQCVPRIVILDETVEYSLLLRLKSGQPTVGVLVLAGDPAPLYQTMLRAAGATRLDRNTSTREILAAVDRALHEGPTFAAIDSQHVAQSFPAAASRLTTREVEVLKYVSRRKPYAEIACALGIKVETVRKHTASIRRKLNVRSRQDLFGKPVPYISTGQRR